MDTESHQWNFVDVLLKHLRSEDNPCCKTKMTLLGELVKWREQRLTLSRHEHKLPRRIGR